MINNLLFSRTVVPDLEKSMETYTLRQKTLANNVANVMTPGYRALQVSFEDEYRKSLYDTERKTMPMIMTHSTHIPTPPPDRKTFSQIHPTVGFKDTPMNDSGFNNVDIDREMAEMAENSLRYEMSTKLMTKRFANIKSAVRGR